MNNKKLLILFGFGLLMCWPLHKASAETLVFNQPVDADLAHAGNSLFGQFVLSDSPLPVTSIQIKVANPGLDISNCTPQQGWRMNIWLRTTSFQYVFSNNRVLFTNPDPTVYTFTFDNNFPANRIFMIRLELPDPSCLRFNTLTEANSLLVSGSNSNPLQSLPGETNYNFFDGAEISSNTLPDFDMWLNIFSSQDSGPTLVSGQDVESVHWTKAMSPIIVENGYTFLYGTLTIDPGVIVKFKPGAALTVSNYYQAPLPSILNAVGSASEPIIFTSYKDDSVGGDSNGDGNASVPQAGDWSAVRPFTEASQVAYAEFRYGDSCLFPGDYIEIHYNHIKADNCNHGFRLAIMNRGDFTDSILENNQYGISDWSQTDAGFTIKNNKIYNSSSQGLFIQYCNGIIVSDNDIRNNPEGIRVGGCDPAAKFFNNNIVDNSGYGLIFSSQFYDPNPVEASNNWWGDPSGPFEPTKNPGGKGNPVFGNVNFSPWLGEPINNTPPPPPPTTKTPVLIIPGVLGTEIKKGDELLWPDFAKMIFGSDTFMDPLQFREDLNPLDTSLLSGAVIRNPNNLFDYTASLIDELKAQGYTEGQDLFTFPYDWRFGVSEETVSQLRGQIEYILNQTQPGQNARRVDVIAHSTGGLILKKYVQDYPANHGIGKAVMVGVPNLGSPKALKVLLQGDNFNIPVLNDEEMKKLAQNMPVVYDLAPSQKYYDTAGSYFKSIDVANGQIKDLNFVETNQFLKDHQLANTMALDNASNLHSSTFDNFDMRNDGVDVYTLTGCGIGTFDKTSYTYDNYIVQANTTSLASGDQTVPKISAESIPADSDHEYYVSKVKHSELLSDENSRHEIVNLLSGANLSVDNNIIITKQDLEQNPNKCKLKGHWYQIFSPVGIEVIDQYGNRAGLLEDGSIQNDIPGADYEVMGDHKFVYIPTDEGQTYTINLQGTGNGIFTFKDSVIDGDQITQTQVFSNIPVTPTSSGEVTLDDGADTNLIFDNKEISSQVVDPNQKPEFIIKFDSIIKDLDLRTWDSSNILVQNGTAIDAYDTNGNVTEINFSQKNKKTALSADVTGISYDGVSFDFSKNNLSFSWNYNSTDTLINLVQTLKTKKEYKIKAVYKNGNTIITGSDKNGKIDLIKPGLWLLQVNTEQGDLGWQILPNN